MYLPLNFRQLQILKHLTTASTPTDISELVETFNKSDRTIRYDINRIRQAVAPYDITLKTKTKRGFYIPAAQKQACAKLLSEQSGTTVLSTSNDSMENRYNTLFFLLLCQRQRIPADVIANKLFVSRSTVLRMLSNLPSEFAHGFTLEYQKSSGYQISGEEYHLRKIAGSLLAALFKGSYTTEDWYLLLPQVVKEATNLQRIVCIANSIKKSNTKHNVWISNTAFIQLLSYCIVR